jgi:zinc finger protein 830
MADVRALLKAKRQEARITHPYAAYGSNGALRCTACGVPVKFASAWEGHLGSKSHRIAVANLKAKQEEVSARATSTTVMSKRKAGEDGADEGGGFDDDEQMEVETGTVSSRPGKRQRTEEREVEAHAPPSSGPFPMGFFSDPSRAIPLRGQDDDEDEDEMDQDEKGTTSAAAPKSQLDMEWDAFERDMQNISGQQHQRQQPAGDGTVDAATTDPQEAYARATIAAEPELVPSSGGLPASGRDGGAAAAGVDGQGEGEAEERKKAAVSEAEERRRKEMDERELIIDRLVEEERAQEDAYNRVAMLRNRVQVLKQKRELAKTKGKKADIQS